MNIYFISGLGADSKAFEKIMIGSEYKVHYIDWLEPHQHEKLEHYAGRMADSIEKDKPFILIGLSFGGIVSIEISKLFRAERVILISSISNRHELPWYYRTIGKLTLQNTKAIHLLKQNNEFIQWYFGTHSKRLKDYLNKMIEKTSDYYLLWSLTQIIQWQQADKKENVFHIHGNADKIFPVRYCKPDHIVKKGGHFMVLTHAKEITQIIQAELKTLNT
jgi:pimeloyl-ACP methyl ester carboxylesterase